MVGQSLDARDGALAIGNGGRSSLSAWYANNPDDVAAFEKQLLQTPADAEAKAGLSTVRLMRRTQGADLDTVRTNAANGPRDLEAQLLAAVSG